MYSYILEHGDEQLLNTTLSAKAQIYLLLYLVCRVDREILDDIYKLKCQYEDDEKRESLVYNKNHCMAYIRYGMCITSQINTMYPYYMMYNEKKLNLLKTKYNNVSCVSVLNTIYKHLKHTYKNDLYSIHKFYKYLNNCIKLFIFLMEKIEGKDDLSIKIIYNSTYGILIHKRLGLNEIGNKINIILPKVNIDNYYNVNVN